MTEPDNHNSSRFLTPLQESFGLNPKVALAVVIGCALVLALTVFWFFYSAPPTTVTITSGPPGSSFETNAIQYAEILARAGVKLKILPSQGSEENLERLNNHAMRVDVGFVQVGPASEMSNSDLMSLGSIAYQPLLIFYRSQTNIVFAFRAEKQAAGHWSRRQRHTVASPQLVVFEWRCHQRCQHVAGSGRSRSGRRPAKRNRGCRVFDGGFRFLPNHATAATHSGNPHLQFYPG
jgi:hypothetical protein